MLKELNKESRSRNVVFIRASFQFLFLCFLFSCTFNQEELTLPSSTDQDILFIKPNHADLDTVLEKSNQFYSGSPQCSSDKSCLQVCKELFSNDLQKKCSGLKSQQVFQIQKMYEIFLSEDLAELQKINAFDLKVFFSLSSENFFEFLKEIKPHSTKSFLIWIAEDWKIASVFQQTDKKFIYMQLFLNQLNISPISSLREDLKEDRTFVELSWLKQNDTALIWLNDYLESVYCESKDKDCLLGVYCMLYDTWEPDILQEMQSFNFMSLGANINFNAQCSERCVEGNCGVGV